MGATSKPFCLIDEAKKAALRVMVRDRSIHPISAAAVEKISKAVLDRIVPLIVERCAEVAERNERHHRKWIAKEIRALKPKEKSDGG